MAGTILEKRELYINVEVKEGLAEEIYLYQADFYRDRTCQTREMIFQKEDRAKEEGRQEDKPDGRAETTPGVLEQFKEKWELLCREEVPTECFAADAGRAMDYVFEPLMKKYPGCKVIPELWAGREFLHDCISMGRVVSMSAFDEEKYLSAEICRKIKERYHEYVDEIKKERPEHIFIRQAVVDDMAVFQLFITDAQYRIQKQVMLHHTMKEETLAVRFREILSLYPEADVIVDAGTPELYRLFHNMNQFMSVESGRILFSLESMLAALGKRPECTDIIKTYLLYVKNQEEMRHGNFFPDRLYSIHSFYLPVQLSGEAAWTSQFRKNLMWQQEGRECYCISMEGEREGKYVVKAGKEQFGLKLRKISIHRYLKRYAVLRLDVENYYYPGEEDRERINQLAACLIPDGEPGGAEQIEIKVKDTQQSYAFSTAPVEGEAVELWPNALMQMGGKKEKKKKGRSDLVLYPMKEYLYCVEAQEVRDEEQLIQTALIRDGVFRKIEDALAKAIRPENGDRPSGSLLKRQKQEIKALFEIYRYMMVSFGENFETAQRAELKPVWQQTEQRLGTTAVTERLQKKFALFF
ncbi:MAG: hypothetical protein J6A77_07955 [Lachnospiraceae bacterium]|nr:hypothetical protein [Lachnospiraceae bacterium]